MRSRVGKGLAIVSLALFFGLLVGLPIARQVVRVMRLPVFDSFYRAGSLVFGGGHVVLPLLQAEVVTPGWVTNEEFIAGYGAAQAVPGPLFTFAGVSRCGDAPAAERLDGRGVDADRDLPAVVPADRRSPAVLGAGARRPSFQAALRGINAAVVGLLLAALFDPVWTSAITSHADFGLALVAFGLLVFWRVPPWLVVAVTAIGGALIA